MITALTQKGAEKNLSEDAVLIGSRILSDADGCFPFLNRGIVCIADGVGGVPGGAEAARFLTESLCETENLPQNTAQLKNLLQNINRTMIRQASGTCLSKMAAALTGILVTDTGSFCFHAGNTRAFLMQGNYLRQLTDDHTLRQRLLQLGQHEMSAACNPNELIGCFGGGDPAFANVLTVSLLPEFQTVVLTSDGIHDHIGTDRMEEILSGSTDDREACRMLLREARLNGSADDGSVVILRKD